MKIISKETPGFKDVSISYVFQILGDERQVSRKHQLFSGHSCYLLYTL
jgi:hypothetical protein